MIGFLYVGLGRTVGLDGRESCIRRRDLQRGGKNSMARQVEKPPLEGMNRGVT